MTEPDAVVVRELVEADWAQVWSIIEQVVRAGDTFPFPTDLSETVARQVWLDNGPDGRASVATSRGQVLGTAKMGRNRPGPGAHVATASYMVTQTARGRGVGRALSSTRWPGLGSRVTPQCSSTQWSTPTVRRPVSTRASASQ